MEEGKREVEREEKEIRKKVSLTSSLLKGSDAVGRCFLCAGSYDSRLITFRKDSK